MFNKVKITPMRGAGDAVQGRFFVLKETLSTIKIKNLRGIALQRKGIMPLMRPAAGGESCCAVCTVNAGAYFTGMISSQ